MVQNIIRVIFIVLFAIALACSVIYAIEFYKGDEILGLVLCLMVAAVSTYRIVYYAKGLSNKTTEE